MAEYIDRAALDKALTIAAANGKDKDRRTWAKAICVLHDMPAADVVPVVRCRDCQWVDKPECCPLHLSDLTEGGEALPHRADFCSYGERKESRH